MTQYKSRKPTRKSRKPTRKSRKPTRKSRKHVGYSIKKNRIVKVYCKKSRKTGKLLKSCPKKQRVFSNNKSASRTRLYKKKSYAKKILKSRKCNKKSKSRKKFSFEGIIEEDKYIIDSIEPVLKSQIRNEIITAFNQNTKTQLYSDGQIVDDEKLCSFIPYDPSIQLVTLNDCKFKDKTEGWKQHLKYSRHMGCAINSLAFLNAYTRKQATCFLSRLGKLGTSSLEILAFLYNSHVEANIIRFWRKMHTSGQPDNIKDIVQNAINETNKRIWKICTFSIINPDGSVDVNRVVTFYKVLDKLLPENSCTIIRMRRNDTTPGHTQVVGKIGNTIYTYDPQGKELGIPPKLIEWIPNKDHTNFVNSLTIQGYTSIELPFIIDVFVEDGKTIISDSDL